MQAALCVHDVSKREADVLGVLFWCGRGTVERASGKQPTPSWKLCTYSGIDTAPGARYFCRARLCEPSWHLTVHGISLIGPTGWLALAWPGTVGRALVMQPW
mmetsp:Transcript_87426/g.234124  ORF Transcript_87426/g.234124 Transcript_87426/m.234124 type:complete len:102 (+) Transcript_87426:25-330(+)